LLTFFAAAKKVSAAPHRGNANRPLSQQGKATILFEAILTPIPRPLHIVTELLKFFIN
jgi:hypothetical protein